MTLAPLALAQQQATTSEGLEEVIVTAQKRTESLQDVPMSITALGTQRLEELNVADFEDYAKFLPSLSFTSFGPGFARVYFRGVAAGDNGNHSGSKPSVGIYLNEQPITTIQGALDVHLYDIERVEALAGPQGTLYGASSQAGTVRIITNRPQFDEFDAGYDLEGNLVDGDGGYVAEGFVNIPVSENAAVRLVGWAKRDAGYIDNVADRRVFPTATEEAGEEIFVDNAKLVEEDYNSVDTYGARAALRINLNDSWTITPSIMGQKQEANGGFATDPTNFGELELAKYYPESSEDRWGQIALTVEGKISNLDLVYAGSYLNRKVDTESDYSDYSYFYDVLYGYLMYDDDGAIINPSQFIQGKDRYESQSHEIRLSSAQDRRFRWVGGLFFQRQEHGIQQDYKVNDLTVDYEVTGWEDSLWLTQQTRIDRDYAVFGELTYDLTDKLSLTGGLRWFKAKNSLEGFFGFGDGYSTSGNSGEALCSKLAGDAVGDESSWKPFKAVSTAPCKNLDKEVDEDGVSPKVNLTYNFDDDRMVYVTYSEGFRPGGVNRRGTFPPYDADYLINYEIGWKTSWADDRVRFNGALFWNDWDDFQFSFLGENGLTNIVNAGGARIKGIEADLQWAATDALRISGGISILDAELTKNFCESVDADGKPLPEADCDPADFAPEGTQLPVAPDFKGNVTARYLFPVSTWNGHVQGSYVYNGTARSALLPAAEEALGGELDSWGVANFSFGVQNDSFSVELFIDNAFDERAELTRFAQCDEAICQQSYLVTNQPRTYGIKFGQRF
jgi:outer membrane receptor protein involved in Fe transport